MGLSVTGRLEHASRVRPYPGQAVGGDTVIVRELERGLFAAVVDVLGHGPEAHELALRIEQLLGWRPAPDQALEGTPDETRWRILADD